MPKKTKKNQRHTVKWVEFGNPAMLKLGPRRMFKFVRCMPDLTTLFVGSGGGHFPAYYGQITGRHIVLIDPAPGSFMNLAVHKKPDYPTVHELHADNAMLEVLKKGYIACINWSEPNMPADKKSEPYDMQYIRLMLPPHLLLIFEPSGGAGSTALLAWLKRTCGIEFPVRNGVPNTFEQDSRHAAIIGYKEVARTVEYTDINGCMAAHTMLWLTLLPNVKPCARMTALVAKNPPDPQLTETDLAYDRILSGEPVSMYDQILIAGDALGMMSNMVGNTNATKNETQESTELQLKMQSMLGMIKMMGNGQLPAASDK